MASTPPRIIRSKDEAERMASAILSAHQSPALPQSARRQPARWKLITACGIATGIIVSILPAHNWMVGALTGLTIGAIAALLGRATGN